VLPSLLQREMTLGFLFSFLFFFFFFVLFVFQKRKSIIKNIEGEASLGLIN
jgi:hypothetical protein